VRLAGATVAVADPGAVAERWRAVIGAVPGLRFVEDLDDRGLVEIELEGSGRDRTLELGSVRLVFDR
jgi:hypothetical protein